MSVQYVARFETRGRLERRQYPQSQQVDRTYSGLGGL